MPLTLGTHFAPNAALLSLDSWTPIIDSNLSSGAGFKNGHGTEPVLDVLGSVRTSLLQAPSGLAETGLGFFNPGDGEVAEVEAPTDTQAQIQNLIDSLEDAPDRVPVQEPTPSLYTREGQFLTPPPTPEPLTPEELQSRLETLEPVYPEKSLNVPVLQPAGLPTLDGLIARDEPDFPERPTELPLLFDLEPEPLVLHMPPEPSSELF